jgi:hypothetical protein
MNTIRTEDKEAQYDEPNRVIQIAKPWTIRWWSEMKLANGKSLVRILKKTAQLIDLEWTEDTQTELKAPVERYTASGTSGAWRVYRLQLASYSLVLGDTEDRDDISGQW